MKLFLSLLLIIVLPLSGYAKECYTLLYIIDGDTIKILYHGRKKSVRLLGIDTPESRKNRRAYYQVEKNHQDVETIIRLGEEARKHLKELLARYKEICLVCDRNNAYSGHRERYGRILAYAYTLDGSLLTS